MFTGASSRKWRHAHRLRSRLPEADGDLLSNYLEPRQKLIRNLEQARSKGLIEHDADPELLMDLISGAIIHHALCGLTTQARRCEDIVVSASSARIKTTATRWNGLSGTF